MRSASSLLVLAAGAVLLLVGAVAMLWRGETSAPISADATLSGVPQVGEEPARMPRVDAPGSPASLLEPEKRSVGFIDVFGPDRLSSHSPSPAGAAACSVHGRVLDHAGAGVPSLTVELHRGREERRAQTDADGRFAFTGLQRGVYRAYVDDASLPEGMRVLPLWKQDVGSLRDDDSIARMHGTSFRLEDESDPEIDLRVFLAGTVRGRLVDSEGRPIVAAPIEIHTAEGIRDEAATDVKGAFVFDEAYPGRCVTSVDLSCTLSAGASSPLPRQFELAPGGTVVLEDLVAGVGGHMLRGSVIDLAGQPVVGLGVLCQEESDAFYRLRWTTVTDGNGRFELGRLPATLLLVSVGADDRDRPPESRLLAENVAPIRVDMRQSPEAVELRPVTVSARHPFHVRGRVEIDRQWAWAEQLDPDGAPRVEVRERGEALWRPLAISPPTRSEWPDAVDTAAPRSFAWSCATPHAQIEFRALLTKQDRSVVERLVAVTPSADGTQDVRLAFP